MSASGDAPLQLDTSLRRLRLPPAGTAWGCARLSLRLFHAALSVWSFVFSSSAGGGPAVLRAGGRESEPLRAGAAAMGQARGESQAAGDGDGRPQL